MDQVTNKQQRKLALQVHPGVEVRLRSHVEMTYQGLERFWDNSYVNPALLLKHCTQPYTLILILQL